jgi:hypothetical protein
VENPGFATGSVDTTRTYFEAIHSLFKQTAARIGWCRTGGRIVLESLLGDDKQADEARQMIRADLAAKLDRLSPSASGLDELYRLLVDSCCHPSNLYTEVHWFPVVPETDNR